MKEETKFVYPTTNLNTDKPETLMRQWERIIEGLQLVMEALKMGTPNARNFRNSEEYFTAKEDWREDYKDPENLKAKYETILETFAIAQDEKNNY